MKNLVTSAVLYTLLIVVHSQDDVYTGSTNFLVYVTFDGRYLCGAALISNQTAIAPYMNEFEERLVPRLRLRVPTELPIFHVEYDEKNPNKDKFAVILLKRNIFAEGNGGPPIALPTTPGDEQLKALRVSAYAIGWQMLEGNLEKKAYTIPNPVFSEKDVGVRMTNEIDYTVHIGGALIKKNILVGIAYVTVNGNTPSPYVLYLNVVDGLEKIQELIEQVKYVNRWSFLRDNLCQEDFTIKVHPNYSGG